MKTLPVFNRVEHSCETCVGMCENRPCWPTPDEAEKMLNAGLARKMMLDYWVNRPEDIYILAPAIVGYGADNAPFWPSGRCILLSSDGLCKIHDSGFKPLEGAVADCQNDKASEGVREFIVSQWDTPKGKKLVQRWEKEVGR